MARSSSSGAGRPKAPAAQRGKQPARRGKARAAASVPPVEAPVVPGTAIGRFPVLDVSPCVDGGRRAAAAAVGEWVEVSATVFREGHDALGVTAVLRAPDGTCTSTSMRHVGQDRWTAWVMPDSPGAWSFCIEPWSDPWTAWLHRAEVKVPLDIDVELELAEGVAVLERAAARVRGKAREALKAAAATLTDATLPPLDRLAAATAPAVHDVLAANPLRELVSPSRDYPLLVQRSRALVGSWYEFFPRSEGSSLDPPRSGTFATAAERLPAVAAMGFDVVYLPPIHPIGRTFRKGPNNTLTPGPDDPGSPWAIGAPEGGHDAVHPDLGTIDDFDAFVARARELGMEVALDLALQASPDHPWVTEHPEWFRHRADGTIAYAENPPKKYQDIYPLYFDTDPEGLYAEVERVTRYWMSHDVRIFRVDNPHTKPVWLWERLIASINATDPDVLFLAEAFTRPPMMRTLAEVGFQQSYTYFTWRNTKWELEEYLRELSTSSSAFMRPNFFVNTPDILPEYLQHGGRGGFSVRATLAATMSPTWGVYSGFELYENAPVRAGSEEYLDSEKYQFRPRDWVAAQAHGDSLAPYLTLLNGIRREHPALHGLRNIRFHGSEDDAVIAFSKRDGDAPDADCVLVVVNLDPWNARETRLHLDMGALGLGHDEPFLAVDLVSHEAWTWYQQQYVKLVPWLNVAHIVHVRRLP